MMKTTVTIAVAAALGGGSAIGLSACGGEDRPGDVQFQGDTETSTTGTGTETTGTETTGTETTGTETTP